jgi:hypothetical protein
LKDEALDYYPVENSLWKGLWTRKVDYVTHEYSLNVGPWQACRCKTGCGLDTPGLGSDSLASKTQINDDVYDLTTVSVSNILIALVIDESSTRRMIMLGVNEIFQENRVLLSVFER